MSITCAWEYWENTNACLGNVHCVHTTLMGIHFLQQTRARVEISMMKWICLINRSRNSITLCTSPFSNFPVGIPFSLTPPNHLHLSWLHHYHPFSFLHSSSQLPQHSLHPSYFSSLTYFPLPPLVPELKRTSRQTAERTDSWDQTFILNYNPSK